MTDSKIKREPITVMRKRECSKLSNEYINKLIKQGYNIDPQTEQLIRSVFERVLISNKAYRVYHALDENSPYYNEARNDIKFGTKHHMYLSENNLLYGMPTAEWLNQSVSIGMNKQCAIEFICDEILNDKKYYDFVKRVKIKYRK